MISYRQLLLVLILSALGQVALAQEHDHGAERGTAANIEHGAALEGAIPAAKRGKKAQFGRFVPLFRELCEGFNSDGWFTVLDQAVRSNVIFDDSCPICRPFFFSFASQCDAVQVAAKKKVGVQDTHHKQYEPALSVLNTGSEVFRILNEERDTFIGSEMILLKFITSLRQAASTGAMQKNYIEVLIPYLEATSPMAVDSQQVEKKAKVKERVDDMFEF